MSKVLFFSFIGLLFVGGCADVENVQQYMTGHTYGFWGGLWHGMTAWFSFFGMLFSDEIAVFAINNNGGWYILGFCLGIGVFSGGVSKST